MGTSKKLRARLCKRGISDLPVGKIMGRGNMPSIEKFVKGGTDPVHAAYAVVQHITSYFSESVSQLPEMRKFATIVAEAEDEYLPLGPPMSPLTTSFFTSWAFFDLRFDGTDTLASCLIEANDVVGLTPEQLDALKKLTASRMGIYEHVGMVGSHVRLRELITNAEFTCHNGSGYQGRAGELWYVRLVPPLSPSGSYYIAFTTPYVLMASKDDWLQFLRRNVSSFDADTDRLYCFLKYGLGPNYWNEFVFTGYHHHLSGAIFLAGIPDLKGTLPHAW